MNLMITGATGFFGKALLKSIYNQKLNLLYDKIYLVGRKEPSPGSRFSSLYSKIPNAQFISWDIGIEEIPSVLLNTTDIIHAAADSTVGPILNSRERFERICRNADQMSFFCDAAKHLKNFLFVSTGGVYQQDSSLNTAISETSPIINNWTDCRNAYPIAKLYSEHRFSQVCNANSIKYTIARCFSFVGMYLPPAEQYAISNFYKQLVLTGNIVINGNGKSLRSFMHQDDLAEWLISLLDLGENCNVYNVGSDNPVSVLDLAHTLIKMLDSGGSVSIRNEDGFDPRPFYVPDINKAKLLGLKLERNFEKGISEYIKERRSDEVFAI